MANPLTITAATNTLRLDAKRRAETQFTVFNSSGRDMRGRARLVPQNPAAEKWLTLVGEAERDFHIGGTQQYVVQIAVPPDAPAGSYPFRLDMVGVENPDEELTQGPSVTFDVPGPEPAKKPFPIWIPIAAILALVVIVGVIVAVMLSRNADAQERANATATAVALQNAAGTAQARTTETAIAMGGATAAANATNTAAANATNTAVAQQQAASATETALASFSYDFITRADTVTWRAGPPLVTLPFNGNDGDARGFVLWRYNYPLNDGTRGAHFLETHPAWVVNGTIYGCYTDVYVGANMARAADRISGKVGFIAGGGAGSVTFRISVQAPGLTEQDIVSIPLAYAGGVRTFDRTLGTGLQGRPLSVCLYADAGPSAAQDWASWIDVKLTR